MDHGNRWSVKRTIDLDSYLIREFNFEQDYQRVINLWESAGPGIHIRRSDEPGEILKKLERDPDLFLIAEKDREIIGSVIGGFDGRRGMMYHLAVRIDERSRGIGTALMDALEVRLREKGCIRYYLMVTYENEEAIQFYKNRGWEKMDLHAFGKDL